MKTSKISKSQKADVRRLFKEGKKRNEIAIELGLTYNQVQYCLLKTKSVKKYTRSVEPTVEVSSSPSYAVLEADYANLSARYRKAIALLIEHDLIDVQF